MTTPQEEAHAKLEEVINAYTNYLIAHGEIITDAVLIVGVREIDDEGDCLGRVMVLPRGGYQAPYITKGLLTEAIDLIQEARLRSAN